MVSIAFPSIIESHNYEIRNVAPDLVNGLKLHEEDMSYIIGNLAMAEGTSPTKATNSSPADLDYRLLAKAGLLIAHIKNQISKYVVSGFPYSTYHVNREAAQEYLSGLHQIQFNLSPFTGKNKVKTASAKVVDVEIIPEIEGCALAARRGETSAEGNFFIASFGYGSFEACLSTPNGIVHRTICSLPGIRFALDLAIREIAKTHFLGMRTEHQFDRAFQEGFVILNRRRIDIGEVRKRSLIRYYHDVIFPVLRDLWRDDDFKNTTRFFLTGGGALYSDLVTCFRKDFEDILKVEVVGSPITFASRGYYLKAIENAGGDKDVAMGLDIGNAQTVITFTPKMQVEEEVQ